VYQYYVFTIQNAHSVGSQTLQLFPLEFGKAALLGGCFQALQIPTATGTGVSERGLQKRAPALSVADPHRKNADADADPGKNLNADADPDPDPDADADADADSCSY
jgi:hypothetical protein